MTITIDITPEAEAELARQAAAQGRAIESYAASLLEEAARLPVDATPVDATPVDATQPAEEASRSKSLREVFKAVQGLADDVDFSRNPSTGRPIDLS
jgi:hypothetical protein